MMKILIVYYSFSGNNELLAKKLQAILNCDVLRITESRNRTGFTIILDLMFRRNPKIEQTHVPVLGYVHLILIAPIWAGRIATPLKSFIKRLGGKIPDYSFITLCGGSGNVHVHSELVSLTGKKPSKLFELAVDDIVRPGTLVKVNSSYRAKEEDFLRVESILQNFIHDVGLKPKGDRSGMKTQSTKPENPAFNHP